MRLFSPVRGPRTGRRRAATTLILRLASECPDDWVSPSPDVGDNDALRTLSVVAWTMVFGQRTAHTGFWPTSREIPDGADVE
jgi:hypothetical protein